jgi:hypothetical protein
MALAHSFEGVRQTWAKTTSCLLDFLRLLFFCEIRCSRTRDEDPDLSLHIHSTAQALRLIRVIEPETLFA